MNTIEENKAKQFYLDSFVAGQHFAGTNDVRLNYLDMVRLMHDYSQSVKSEYIKSISDNTFIERVRGSVSDAEVRRMLKTAKPQTRYMVPLFNDPDDDLMTVNEFNQSIINGSISRDNGSGYWVKDGFESNEEVFSSLMLDATHVIWYNK